MTERAKAERKLAWTLCAPAVIAMLLVTGYPICYAIYLSLQRYDLRFPDDKEFVGLSNYVDVLTSSTWWTDVFNTLVITVSSVAIELGARHADRARHAPCDLRPAAARGDPDSVRDRHRGRRVRMALRLTPGRDSVQGWLLVADDANPLGNRGLFVVIILTEVWKTTPFMALLLLAGLLLVPDEPCEAAKVDGANAWQRFFRITVPLMMPAILVAVLFRTLDAFRV